jgi:hypothetical protein
MNQNKFPIKRQKETVSVARDPTMVKYVLSGFLLLFLIASIESETSQISCTGSNERFDLSLSGR